MNRKPLPVPDFPGAFHHLIVYRHEERAQGDFITEEGQERFRLRAKKLLHQGVVHIGTTGAVCSDKLRALKSLQAFWKGLTPTGEMWLDNPVENRGLEMRKELYSDDSACDVEAAFRVICEHTDLRTLVVFTHCEMTLELPQKIGKVLGINCPRPFVRYGQGVHFDVLGKKAAFLFE